MYAALLEKKLVLAVEEANEVRNNYKKLNEDEYRCPHCRKKVILILSEEKNAFFKHLALYSNQLGEKEEHHTAKLLLKSAFTAAGFAAKTEIPLASGQIRADVLVSEKLALEVQCAPLSEEEFNHRHACYRQIDVLDLWIVGKRHYLKRSLHPRQLIYFRENKQWGTYYLEVDASKQLLRLKYNVWQEPLSRKVVYQQAVFKLDEHGIRQFWRFKPRLKQFVLNPTWQRAYLSRQLKQKSKLGQKIGEQLYLAHLTVDELPDYLFTKWRKPGTVSPIINFLHKKTNQR